jgi:hypothetical protein
MLGFLPWSEHPGDGPILTKFVKSGNLQPKTGDRVDAGFTRELEYED